jgi:flagellar hook protein FlgE
MLRSLFSSISGMRAHQTMMDVVGNNISNANSVGYKSSNIVFEDTLSQMVRGSSAPSATQGGLNPMQVGLGVKTAAIATNFGQGSTQLTGRSLDVMIQGDGFFVVNGSAGDAQYTRAGSFTLDASGRLTTPDGALVQGWSAVNGVINTNAGTGDITLPIGAVSAPTSTSAVTLGGNIPASTAVGASIVATITSYDGQGNEVPLTFTMTKTAADTWTVATSGATPASQSVSFDPATGALTTASPLAITVGGRALSLDLAQVTQYGSGSSFSALSQDGSAAGSLQSFSLTSDGTLVGFFTNGVKQPIAQLAMASFSNPGGLEKVGNSSFAASRNSGPAAIGTAGEGGRGLMVGGALEMANVDLAAEFTNLIIAQRGFQANSRMITASDEILQDLVNLKR